jgi:hypothetical protein
VLEQLYSETFDESEYGPISLEALAGNVTAIRIHSVTQTKAWTGYFGNITATITLDDADNYTFYNWSSAEPRGQIYASLNDSVDWNIVNCFLFSDATGNDNWNTIESFYNIDYDDADGVNETYTTTGHPDFQIGSNTITGCPTSYIFRDDDPQTADFVNVLLYDDSNQGSGWVYGTLIENKSNASGSPADKTCFNGELCDFQLLVNEDGHDTDNGTTTYYFWVELE